MPEPATLDINAPIELPSPAPAAEPAPAAAPAAAEPSEPGDIMDFDFDIFDGVDSPDPAPRVEPAPPTPQVVTETPQVVTETPAEPAAPAAAPVAEESGAAATPSDLREQVIAANERARQAQAQLEEQRAEFERVREEREELDGKLQSTREAIGQAEATSHPSVQAITAPFEQKLRDVAEDMIGDGGDGAKLLRLAPQLIAERTAIGAPDSEGFEERRGAFLANLDDHFPEDRKQVAAILTEGARISTQASQQVQAIVQDAEKYRYDAQVQQHRDAVSHYDEIEKGFGHVPPEIRESDPNDRRVILETLIEEIPALKERGNLIKQHLRRVNLPLAPLDPQQMAALSEEDQAAHMQERVARYENDRLSNVAVGWENHMWAQVGPLLYKMLQDVKGRATDVARNTPAPRDSAAEHIGSSAPEEQALDPGQFEIDPNPAGL